jgi:hypothetical protein
VVRVVCIPYLAGSDAGHVDEPVVIDVAERGDRSAESVRHDGDLWAGSVIPPRFNVISSSRARGRRRPKTPAFDRSAAFAAPTSASSNPSALTSSAGAMGS